MHRPIAVLALCSFAAFSAFAVQVGPETPVATPTIDTAPHLRGTPRVASNGTDFLVAWYDQRGGATEIRATRVDRDGNLLDAESLLIGADSGAALSVASDGGDYLVAYNCHPSGPGICVARVDAETGVVAHAASVDGVNPSLASNGNGYLLIHQSGAQNLDVRGRALREDGVPAGEPFEIGTSGYAPSVAANDDAYFVLWSTHAHLEGVLVSGSAVIGVKQRFTTAAPAFGPGPFTWSVASNGDDFFVAWQQNAGVVGTEYTGIARESRLRDGSRVGVRKHRRRRFLATARDVDRRGLPRHLHAQHVTGDRAVSAVRRDGRHPRRDRERGRRSLGCDLEHRRRIRPRDRERRGVERRGYARDLGEPASPRHRPHRVEPRAARR